MRSFTAALLGLAVALPLGMASVTAHADSDSYYNQSQPSDQGWNNRDRSDWSQRNDEHARRYGWNNDNGDQGWNRGDQQHGDQWNRNREGWRHEGNQFGYNNSDHRWDNNNGWRSGNRYGDNSDRGDQSNDWQR